MKPSKHVSIVRQDCAIILYELVKGYEVNVWRIIKESILDYVKGKFLRNIPPLYLTTILCIKGCVKFNEEGEEMCPKASSLTLAGVLKAPVESGEREREERIQIKERGQKLKSPRIKPLQLCLKREPTVKRGEVMKQIQSSQCTPLL